MIAISHRGDHSALPENTIPAFLRALELGADGIELDVHATRDGEIVVYHDFELKDGRAVASVTRDELRRVELSPGIGIPTLKEVFEAVSGRATLFIEAKARNVEQPLAACLKGLAGGYAVHSFNHQTVYNLKKLLPEVHTGILQVGRLIDSSAAMRAAGAGDLWQHHDYMDRQLVEEIHGIGGRIIAWTPNTRERWDVLANYGVDGICTDKIDAYTALGKTE